MADFTVYKSLELPKSNEKYSISVANKNNMVIDSELHKLELKNQSQDELLATKEALKKIADAVEENEAVVEALDAAIRNKVNQTDILKNIESINGNTTEGKLVDALVVKEVFQSVSNGKQLVASAITDKGVNTEATDTFEIMAENIGNISSGGSSELESPLIYNFNFLISFGVSESDFYFYFPIQKIKKMIIKSLRCNLLIPISNSANSKKIYFEFIGYNKELGRDEAVKSFSSTITCDLKSGAQLIYIENMEVDLSNYENLKYLNFYAENSSTSNVNDNYPYHIQLQECILELYT